MTIFCSLTYLQSFTPEELGLPDTCTREEAEEAAHEMMQGMVKDIEDAGYYHNDLEISVN